MDLCHNKEKRWELSVFYQKAPSRAAEWNEVSFTGKMKPTELSHLLNCFAQQEQEPLLCHHRGVALFTTWQSENLSRFKVLLPVEMYYYNINLWLFLNNVLGAQKLYHLQGLNNLSYLKKASRYSKSKPDCSKTNQTLERF